MLERLFRKEEIIENSGKLDNDPYTCYSINTHTKSRKVEAHLVTDGINEHYHFWIRYQIDNQNQPVLQTAKGESNFQDGTGFLEEPKALSKETLVNLLPVIEALRLKN